jgi:hypothetical protein
MPPLAPVMKQTVTKTIVKSGAGNRPIMPPLPPPMRQPPEKTYLGPFSGADPLSAFTRITENEKKTKLY